MDFVARQLGVDAGSFGFCEWTGSTIKRHRAEIRTYHGFRECTVADAEALTRWLAGEYAQEQRRFELFKDAAGGMPVTVDRATDPGSVERIVRSELHQAERLWPTRP